MTKYKRKTKKVVCNNCGNEFDKTLSEIKRTEKRGGKHYCSLKCNAKKNAKFNLGDNLGKGDSKRFTLKINVDEYTPFREFLRRARRRKLLGNLTLNDLKKQWESQQGICPYSGIKLKIKNKNDVDIFELASLDRIDSDKLYEKGNVEFVSTPINYMKNSMSKEKTIEYCKIINNFWGNKMGTNKP